MSDWTSGYVAEIGYTYGYYSELNPLRLRLAFANAGLVAPASGTACELGYGQGLSINLHAAGSLGRWIGTDFNPAQASFAQELAAVSGAGAALFDQSFAEFCGRADLPDFDFIGMHGIWSWISDENRAVIVDFVRRKLKVGGVFYISYNAQPGWAAMAPLRDLLLEHGEVMGAPGAGIVNRIDTALDFAERLLATKPLYARANPQVAERLKRMKEQNRNYLAHEYFNRDWLPMSFYRMAEWLAPARLNFACSANYMGHVTAANLPAEQRALLKEIPEPLFRETVRDFMVNEQFRKDYWVRGARKLNPLERAEALRRQSVMLVQPRADVSLKVNSALGEARLQENVYAPILDALADHQPRTLAQIEQAVKDQSITVSHVVEAVLVLIGTGALHATQDPDVAAKAKPQTDRLNAFLCDKARGSGDNTFLASPVTGGGIAVPRLLQLFLLAKNQGRNGPAEWAQFAWATMSALGQKAMKDGKPLETAEQNLAELNAQARLFADKALPILVALGIA